MSAIVRCPECGAAMPFHRQPIVTCPHCQAVLPEAVLVHGDRALAVGRAPKPLLLQLGMIGSLLFGAVVPLLLILAPFNIGAYFVDRAPATGPEFLRAEGLPSAILGGLLLAIGLGLWLEHAWTRLLMIGFWLLIVATGVVEMMTGSVTAGHGLFGHVERLIALALAGWYLYLKPNVVAYYKRLDRATTAARPGSDGEFRSRGL
ncbi:MAG: hypothetical protein ACREOJ_03845 [Gemmatimonadaceae bacterium]